MRNTIRQSGSASRVPVWVLLALVALVGPAAGVARGQGSASVLNSPHNLSAGGPGSVRATGEQQVCIFCHTPHNASPVQPLWNRSMSVTPYIPYTSNSLQARPGQPTGTSKLCLSCHDGTIALGSVVSRGQPIPMAGGMTTLPPGHRANLGTDLSDDHPISFRYDDDLAAKDLALKSPNTLPIGVRLDSNRELQCTTCHDAHDNSRGDFLVMDNTASQLCNSCHSQGTTDIVSHMQCASCHVPHTAPSKAYLLKGQTVGTTCTRCHSSGEANPDRGSDVLTDLNKLVKHDTNSPVSETVEQHIPNGTSCGDCHESHTMMGQSVASAPTISPKMGNIDGINLTGAAVAKAQFEYEVCFKCHADQAAARPRVIGRQLVQNNKRLQFSPSAVSYHPVTMPGKASDVPSLVPGLTQGASMIYCSDCHNSDTSGVAGSSGPNGVHGSNNPGLLVARYETADGTAESANNYALCYRCHEQASILANESFPLHSRHIVDAKTPCAVCHDSHGIASGQGNPTNNAHLINFATAVVQPDPVSGRLEYQSTGPKTGQCYLSCHGVAHSPKAYPVAAGGDGVVAPLRQQQRQQPVPLRTSVPRVGR